MEKICICLDIDETLINSKTQPEDLVDFNGSDSFDDARAWINCLDELKTYCASKGNSTSSSGYHQ